MGVQSGMAPGWKMNSFVSKTLDRSQERQDAAMGRAGLVHLKLELLWTLVSIASFAGSSWSCWHVIIDQETIATQSNLQAELAAQVPASALFAPMVAFSAVLTLNVMNMALHKNVTRLRANLLLLLINCLAFTTDLMIVFGLTPVARADNGRLYHPLRYLQWAHTTPTMLWMLWLSADPAEVPLRKLVIAMVNDVIMVLTGLAATCTCGLLKVAFGAVSFVTFFIVLFYVHAMMQSTIKDAADDETRNTLRKVLQLVLLLWNFFPVVWLAAEASAISAMAEHLAWGVCDYMAKAVFSSQLWQANLVGAADRREAALRAWEDSNRVVVVEKLHTLVSAKDKLVHMIIHELRTPIMGIAALASSLLKDAQSAMLVPVNERHLAMIRSSAASLLNIINTTLTTATAATGGRRGSGSSNGSVAQLDCTAVSIRPLVEEVAGLIRPLVRDDVRLINEVPTGLPAVAADRTKLQQIFFNLIGNAARFTHTGSIRIGARVLGSEHVEMSVVDTGIGVAQDKVDAIFRPYDQGSADIAASYGGTGLGLYLVKLALDAHNSTINVESEVGNGTAFHFALPIAGEELVAATAAAASLRGRRLSNSSSAHVGLGGSDGTTALGSDGGHAHQQHDGSGDMAAVRDAAGVGHSLLWNAAAEPPSTASGGHPSVSLLRRGAPGGISSPTAAVFAGSAKRTSSFTTGRPSLDPMERVILKVPHRIVHSSLQIMSVDDDVINQVVAEQVLRGQRWKVVKATDGLQCLQHIEKCEVLPDLILLDIMMPGMNGYQVAAKLRERYPPALLPIIMVSAKTEEEDVVQALKCGADDYVTKPYKRAEIVERVRAHIRARDGAGKGLEGLLATSIAAAGGGGVGAVGTAAGLPALQPIVEADAAMVVIKIAGLEAKLVPPPARVMSSQQLLASGESFHKSQHSSAFLFNSLPSVPNVMPNSSGGHAPGTPRGGAATVLGGALSVWTGGATTSAGKATSPAASDEPGPASAVPTATAAGGNGGTVFGDPAQAVRAVLAQLAHVCAANSSACAIADLSVSALMVVLPWSPPPSKGPAGGRSQHHQIGAHGIAATADIDAAVRRHKEQVSALCTALLKAVAKNNWPDGTPMSAQVALHRGPARLLPLRPPRQPVAPAPEDPFPGEGGEEGAGSSMALPALPCVPAADALLSLVGASHPGCVVATESAQSGLLGYVTWAPFVCTPLPPLGPGPGLTVEVGARLVPQQLWVAEVMEWRAALKHAEDAAEVLHGGSGPTSAAADGMGSFFFQVHSTSVVPRISRSRTAGNTSLLDSSGDEKVSAVARGHAYLRAQPSSSLVATQNLLRAETRLDAAKRAADKAEAENARLGARLIELHSALARAEAERDMWQRSAGEARAEVTLERERQATHMRELAERALHVQLADLWRDMAAIKGNMATAMTQLRTLPGGTSDPSLGSALLATGSYAPITVDDALLPHATASASVAPHTASGEEAGVALGMMEGIGLRESRVAHMTVPPITHASNARGSNDSTLVSGIPVLSHRNALHLSVVKQLSSDLETSHGSGTATSRPAPATSHPKPGRARSGGLTPRDLTARLTMPLPPVANLAVGAVRTGGSGVTGSGMPGHHITFEQAGRPDAFALPAQVLPPLPGTPPSALEHGEVMVASRGALEASALHTTRATPPPASLAAKVQTLASTSAPYDTVLKVRQAPSDASAQATVPDGVMTVAKGTQPNSEHAGMRTARSVSLSCVGAPALQSAHGSAMAHASTHSWASQSLVALKAMFRRKAPRQTGSVLSGELLAGRRAAG